MNGLFSSDEFRSELMSIEMKATKANINLVVAIENFKTSTLRGKAAIGPEDWKVGEICLGVDSSKETHPSSHEYKDNYFFCYFRLIMLS